MRLFVAVNFEETVLDAIEEAIEEAIGKFPVKRPPWRWSAQSSASVSRAFPGRN